MSDEDKIKELEDKYLRTYADFENYKKRVAKEREEIIQATSERLLRELLEVKDHLELALDHAQEGTSIESLTEGVDLTLKQLRGFLEKFGVREIQALGDPFDPSLHEAIGQEPREGTPPGMVVQEFQKGYRIRERLLRPSRVVVSSEGSKKE